MTKYEQYIDSVKNGVISAGIYTIMAVDRFINMRNDDRFIFDKKKVNKVIRFFLILRHFIGKHSGERFVLPLESAGQPYGDDSDRDGGLEYLTDLQAQISGRRAEYHRHDQSPKDGPRRNLRIVFVGRHKRLVAFPFF